VTGLRCDQVAADVSIFVPGRRLDDNVQVLLRFEAARARNVVGEPVATGNENNLRLRIYGEKAGIEVGAGKSELSTVYAVWQAADHDQPGRGWRDGFGKACERIRRGIRRDTWRRSRSFMPIWLSRSPHETPGALRRSRRCWYERGGRRRWRSFHLRSAGIFSQKLGVGESAVVPVGREKQAGLKPGPTQSGCTIEIDHRGG